MAGYEDDMEKQKGRFNARFARLHVSNKIQTSIYHNHSIWTALFHVIYECANPSILQFRVIHLTHIKETFSVKFKHFILTNYKLIFLYDSVFDLSNSTNAYGSTSIS